ncbi:MAG: DsbA family protein [Owenweeksia sp.]|nr:DsbA family protein [Owenweeksia sp.]
MTDSNYDVYDIYDALCGWCYGFSDIITTFKQKHQGQYNFKVLSGGLVTGERVGPIGVVAGYIKEAHKQVEERTGAKFGDAFLTGVLEPGEEIFDSVPAAMAMGLFRNQVPDKQVEFAARIQKAIYSEGLPPTEWTTFGKCAADFGLKPDEFAEKMQHPKLKELAQEEFKVVQHWGVRRFPGRSIAYR